MLRLYIAEDEIPDADLAALATKVTTSLRRQPLDWPKGPLRALTWRECVGLGTMQSFGTFAHTDVTPLVAVTEHLFVLELFHGPTLGTLRAPSGAVDPIPAPANLPVSAAQPSRMSRCSSWATCSSTFWTGARACAR